jgi:hypothetical protein
VIGLKDFTSSGTVDVSQSGFASPAFSTIDSSGNLWVGEDRHSRVVEFKPPFSTGMDGSLVIGQPDFETSKTVTSQSGFGDGVGGGRDNYVSIFRTRVLVQY